MSFIRGSCSQGHVQEKKRGYQNALVVSAVERERRRRGGSPTPLLHKVCVFNVDILNLKFNGINVVMCCISYRSFLSLTLQLNFIVADG